MTCANTINRFKGDYAFLSNFHVLENPIPYEALFKDQIAPHLVFPTTEHAYVAAKTIVLDERAFIISQPSPGQAKVAGRHVTLRDDWDNIKRVWMWEILMLKFTLNPDLKTKLLDTGDDLLVEGNWHGDRFWGVCLKTNKGENHLGRMLMELRNYLRDMGD